jgi:hypothetical protein
MENFSIQMDPMGFKGLPEEGLTRKEAPVVRKKLKFSKTLKVAGTVQKATVGSMFDHDYLSLMAVNLYPKYPMNTPVEWASIMQDGERIMVVKVDGRELMAHGTTLFF